MTIENKNRKVLRRVFDYNISFKDFLQGYFNLLLDDLNFSLSNLSISSNFKSQVFEALVLPGNETTRVYHRLKVVPKYKIIGKQSGDVVITDGEYTDTYVELINNDSGTATITVILYAN